MKKIMFAFIAVVIVTSAFTVSHGGYHVGDKANDFKLKNVDGEVVSLADYKEAEVL